LFLNLYNKSGWNLVKAPFPFGKSALFFAAKRDSRLKILLH
jgi:hypothetical protein